MGIKIFKKALLYSLALSLCVYENLNANTNDLLTSIESDMAHYESVATATKTNEHYQPYVISTFSGKDLEKLGIVNLEEALGLIPGVDMATDNLEVKTPIFRGSNPQAYGQSKLFIDGVPSNNVMLDAYSEHLKMPVEIIKRIEVVRGSGSKTDGYNAYAGSINVITYAENIEGFGDSDSIVIKGGSYKYGMLSFVKSYELADDFRLTTDFYYQQDDKVLQSGLDGISSGYSLSPPGYNNTALGNSGDTLMWSETYSLGTTISYKDNFYAKLRLVDHTKASGRGMNFYISEDKDSRLEQPNYSLEVGLKDGIGNFKLSAIGGIKYDKFVTVEQYSPDGVRFFDYKTYEEYLLDGNDSIDSMAIYATSLTYTEGMRGNSYSKHLTYYQSSFVEYDGIEDNSLKLGYRVSREETIDTVSRFSNIATGDSELIDYTISRPFFKDDAKRDIVSIFVENSYSFSDSLSFLVGLNYEKTSLTKAQYDPKVSMVYQQNMNNLFKLLYSKSHRNPSWQEMYTQNNSSRVGSEDFEPEKVEAYEVAYVHKIDTLRHLQANLFYLKNTDQIQNITIDEVVSAVNFDNVGDTTIYGLELEYKGYITSNDMFYINYSYTDGKETNTDYLSNVAQHMARGYYSYDITSELSISTVMKYVGKKERSATDIRTEPLKAYTKIDLTTRYDNEKYNYSLMASVKNVFDSDIRFASKQKTYDDDYYQEGRNFMITLKKEF